MKKTSSLIVFILIALSTMGQTVKIKVNNGEPTSILRVDIPINGYKTNYNLNNKKYTLVSSKYNSITFNNNKGGMYIFNVAGICFSLILFPTDNVQIDASINQKDYTLNITGGNAKGNQFWIDYERLKFGKYQPVLNKLENEKSTANIVTIFTHHVDSITNKNLELYKSGEITKEYMQALNYHIKDKFGAFLIEYTQKKWSKNWAKVNPILLKYLDYLKHSNNNYLQYDNETIDWYISLLYDNKIKSPSDYHKILGVYGYIENLPIQISECNYADLISFGATNNTEEFNYKDVYSLFKTKYPNSIYTPYLNKLFLTIKDVADIANPNIKYIDTTKRYNTLEQLVKTNFSNKPVFIDLWATWCGPCKTEFAYSTELHKYLSKNNIQMLYLSIDDSKSDKKWRNYVAHRDLEGYHLRVSKTLYNDIHNKIYNGNQFFVPRYILINSKGEIIDNDMPRPSCNEILYSTFKELLSK